MLRVFAVAAAFLAPTGLAFQASSAADVVQSGGDALDAIKSNNPSQVRAIALIILAQNPTDTDALIALSAAERALGNYDAALKAARTLYQTAPTEALRYHGAMLAAQAQFSKGALSGSQFWLRRATDIAPNAKARARAIRDFKQVRSEKPTRTTMRFSTFPSSNINNGSDSDTVLIYGLPFELSDSAKALSGTAIHGEITAKRSFPVNRLQTASVALDLVARTYILSADTKAKVPEKSGADYGYQQAQLTFGYDFEPIPKPFNKQGPLKLSLALGKIWSGGDPLLDFARIEAEKYYRPTKRKQLEFGLTVEKQKRLDKAERSAIIYAGHAGVVLKLEKGRQLRFTYSIKDTNSDAADIAHLAQSLEVQYSLGKPIMGAQVTLLLKVGRRDYDEGYLSDTLRRDKSAKATVSLFFPKVVVMGFAPTLEFSASRNNSNDGLHQSSQQSVLLGIKSTF